MKTKLILLGIALFIITAMQAQVSIGTLAPPQATLEVTGKANQSDAPDGIIMPRLTGDELKAKDNAYGAAQTSAMVYVTSAVSSASVKTANVTTEGYYYFDGTIWQAVKDGKSHSPSPSPIKPNNSLSLNSADVLLPYNAGCSAAIDFTQGNLAYTTASAGAFTLTGLKDGGTYTLAVQGTASGTASFSQTGITFHIVNNAATTAGKHTLYTFIVMGSDAYVWMTKGF
jgi:hypothetical protein